MANAELSFRGILNPVIARSLIIGVNPFDLESVLRKVETGKILNARSLEKTWRGAWEEKSRQYESIADAAAARGHTLTAQELYLFSSRCMFSAYLINFADIADKKAVYGRCANLYAQSLTFNDLPVKRVEIPLGDAGALPAYLHIPQGNVKAPCAVVYAGLSSCKEEMDVLARALTDRGIAALVPDMPGCGESLFYRDLKCRRTDIAATFHAAIDFLEKTGDVNAAHIGAIGLCMGGGYAYAAASLDNRYSFCATLFPLMIGDVDEAVTPQWMKDGMWFNYQTGHVQAREFEKNMIFSLKQAPSCPYFCSYGTHDNWMGKDKVLDMFNKATHPDKKRIEIDEQPVFSAGQAVTHTMPVGEQLHWVRRVMADWIYEQCSRG